MSSTTKHATVGRRNPQLDLLRILFATLVLLAHAPELTDGNRSREILNRIVHHDMTFGVLAVDGFFLLSGFLIMQSWDRDAELLNFLRKRVLRIVPGYLVAAVSSTVVLGFVAPGVPHWFHHLGPRFMLSLALISSPVTPAIMPGDAGSLVNGSLWTIQYEVGCYLAVAVAGICGLIRRPALVLGATMMLFAIWVWPILQAYVTWHHLLFVTGDPKEVYRMSAIFFLGACFYLFRARIGFYPWVAVLAGALAKARCFCSPLIWIRSSLRAPAPHRDWTGRGYWARGSAITARAWRRCWGSLQR